MRTITPVESFVLAVIVGIVVFLLLATQGCQTQTKPYSAARPMPVTRAMAPAEPYEFKLMHCPQTSEYLTLQTSNSPAGPWSNVLSVVVMFGTCYEFHDGNPNPTQGFYRVWEHAPTTNAVIGYDFLGAVPVESWCKSLATVHESGRTYRVKENW